MIERALLPPFGHVLTAVDVFREEALFVRDAQEVENRRDHVHVGNQDRLRQLRGELVVVLSEAFKHTRTDLAQHLGIEFGGVQARLETVEELVGLELPQRDGTQQFGDFGFTQAQKNVGELHKHKAYYVLWRTHISTATFATSSGALFSTRQRGPQPS